MNRKSTFAPTFRLFVFLLAGLAWLNVLTVRAQDIAQPPFDVTGSASVGGFGGSPADAVVLSASFEVAEGSSEGRLHVKAELSDNWHIYSITQLDGGPQRTQLVVETSAAFEVTGDFRPAQSAEIHSYPYFDVAVEEHAESVTWTAPLQLKAGVKPSELTISITLDGQICEDGGSCVPLMGRHLAAKFTGYYAGNRVASPLDSSLPTFRIPNSYASLRGQVSIDTSVANAPIQLQIGIEPDANWHVYAYSQKDENGPFKPTMFALQLPGGWKASQPVASSPPIRKELSPDAPPVLYHERDVTWTFSVQPPANTPPGEYEIAGVIGYQTCTNSTCDMPLGAEFVARAAFSDNAQAALPLEFHESRYSAVAAALENATSSASEPLAADSSAPPSAAAPVDLSNLQTDRSDDDMSLSVVLLSAFAAGFLLNFMPCVLPVIGLKIMSFANQAGDSRGRIFALNFWFALGMLSIYMVLATLAVQAGMNWGEQFSSPTFSIVLACVVFVFSLSFLGVWEIPIPGFVGRGKANEISRQEGGVGAFAMGALTTILATPCSGPLLIPALTWAVRQPPIVTYGGFACVGLGMASPYLLVGAFPSLLSRLPKPGMWMETFKHVMGFALLIAVVWVMTFLPIPYVVPTVALLFGLWAAAWWVGQIPITASLDRKLSGWVAAIALAGLVAIISFGLNFSIGGRKIVEFDGLQGVMLARLASEVDREIAALDLRIDSPQREHDEDELPWQPYSRQRLEELLTEQKTVLVDFTADWCLTCKTNEALALNQRETKKFLEENNIAALKADKTDSPPEIEEMLKLLGNEAGAVPFYAIFPAGAPQRPITLDGLFTTPKPIIEALQKAVAVQPESNAAASRTAARY